MCVCVFRRGQDEKIRWCFVVFLRIFGLGKHTTSITTECLVCLILYQVCINTYVLYVFIRHTTIRQDQDKYYIAISMPSAGMYLVQINTQYVTPVEPHEAVHLVHQWLRSWPEISDQGCPTFVTRPHLRNGTWVVRTILRQDKNINISDAGVLQVNGRYFGEGRYSTMLYTT